MSKRRQKECESGRIRGMKRKGTGKEKNAEEV